MSELRVSVDGKEREIRGVNEGTTCEDIILVLAKAEGKTGKVALLEKWRDYERILPPDESPLKCIQSWGAYRNDVSLILKDESLSENNLRDKSSDASGIDGISYYESHKDAVDFQQRKLHRLTRELDILNLQLCCYNTNDEAFLYLTEDEITQDLSVELEEVLKLQVKELNGLESLEEELQCLEQIRQNLSQKRDGFETNISSMEERIAEANDGIDMLLEELKLGTDKLQEKEGFRVKRRPIREELGAVAMEISYQNDLFSKQDLQLASIRSTLKTLNNTIQSKNDFINQLKENIIEYDEVILSDDFRRKLPEAESKHLVNGRFDLHNGMDENIQRSAKETVYKTKIKNCKRPTTLCSDEKEEERSEKNVSKSKNGKTTDKHEVGKSEKMGNSISFSKRKALDVDIHTTTSNGSEKEQHNSAKLNNSISSNFLPIFKSETSSQRIVQDPIPATKMLEIHNKTDVTSTNPPNISKFYAKRKESFKKIRDVFEDRKYENENEKTAEKGTARNFQTQNTSNVMVPLLENTVSPLEEKIHRQDSFYQTYHGKRPSTEELENFHKDSEEILKDTTESFRGGRFYQEKLYSTGASNNSIFSNKEILNDFHVKSTHIENLNSSFDLPIERPKTRKEDPVKNFLKEDDNCNFLRGFQPTMDTNSELEDPSTKDLYYSQTMTLRNGPLEKSNNEFNSFHMSLPSAMNDAAKLSCSDLEQEDPCTKDVNSSQTMTLRNDPLEKSNNEFNSFHMTLPSAVNDAAKLSRSDLEQEDPSANDLNRSQTMTLRNGSLEKSNNEFNSFHMTLPSAMNDAAKLSHSDLDENRNFKSRLLTAKPYNMKNGSNKLSGKKLKQNIPTLDNDKNYSDVVKKIVDTKLYISDSTEVSNKLSGNSFRTSNKKAATQLKSSSKEFLLPPSLILKRRHLKNGDSINPSDLNEDAVFV